MADRDQKDFARTLRRNQTVSEKKMWRLLRSRQFEGIKFRRQQTLGPYVVDFCSYQVNLIIELDGGQHALSQKKDEKRTDFLEKSGFRVVRFWDNDVLRNSEAVLENIRKNLKELPLTPSLSRKGRGGNEKI